MVHWYAPEEADSKRTQRSDEYDASVRSVKEPRRALDLLMAQPALQAFTDTMSHWYFYGPKMAEPARTEFIAKLKSLDTVERVGKAAPASVLLQFGS